MNKKGLLFALGAYICWGLFPIYWKQLQQVSTLQIIAHRIVWAFIFTCLLLIATKRFASLKQALKPKTILIYSLSASLIAGNWLVYVWAVNDNYIIEASLGYFINPLISVLMGVVFLREHLRKLQWLSILLAGIGVLALTLAYGRIPWIALTLASTFSAYGLIKKLARLPSLLGLTIETSILFIPALLYLYHQNSIGNGAFLHINYTTDLFLIGAGIITTITLYMFSSAAKSISLTLIGLLEYIAPTLAFLVGTLLYKEPFDASRLIGFTFIWIALLILTLEGFAPASPQRDA